MKIYTSYYGNLKALRMAGIVPVNIARWKPRWFEGRSYLDVAPLPFMLKDEDQTEEQYVERYKKYVTDNLDITKVVNDLSVMTGGRDCALLCYEKPEDFCHRHLLAEWMTNNGVSVSEFVGESTMSTQEKGDSKPKSIQTEIVF